VGNGFENLFKVMTVLGLILSDKSINYSTKTNIN
jgi:hypothetical protein